MYKVLNYSVGEFLTDVFGDEVQMIVVADDDRGLLGLTSLFGYDTGEGLVYRYVSAVPGIMHRGVYVGDCKAGSTCSVGGNHSKGLQSTL